MEFVEINPEYRDALAELGLASAGDFLSCAGELYSRRPERRVERVLLGGGLVGYLKRETTILLRERLTSWFGGFGWTSKSIREALVLRALADAGIGCPTILALGESGGQAFVLLKEETDFLPLGDYLTRWPDRARRTAQALGRELARLHEAGFYHSDLFAKHILVGQTDGLDRFCLIDWQRTRRLTSVPWSRRIIDLATLDASLHRRAVSPRDRLRLLAEYLRGTAAPRPEIRKLIQAIRSRAWLLLSRPRVRRQNRASLSLLREGAANRSWGATSPRRHDWHLPQDSPLRTREPSLARLSLMEFLAVPVDVDVRRQSLRRRALDRVGRTLRRLREAGYRPDDPDLGSWEVAIDSSGDVEIVLTNVADLAPVLGEALDTAARDIARLFAGRGSPLSPADLVCVVRGYLGPDADRRQRRDLVRRILDARETAS